VGVLLVWFPTGPRTRPGTNPAFAYRKPPTITGAEAGTAAAGAVSAILEAARTVIVAGFAVVVDVGVTVLETAGISVMTGGGNSLVVSATERLNHCSTFRPTLVCWITSPICQSNRASVSYPGTRFTSCSKNIREEPAGSKRL